MRVRCISNDIAKASEPGVRSRMRRSINLQGPIEDLLIGQEYAVQAVEERDGGLWVFIHSIAASDFPYPYPAEMFKFEYESLPPGWSAHFVTRQGTVVCKRISFTEWAEDDQFYERLVDGNTDAIFTYRARRIGSGQ